MKLLLSAYACEPSKGSEPGVGWNWAQALFRRGYDVHVITRSNNRRDIESAYKGQSPPITFYYYDLPKWARFWKYWPGGIYLYYLMWQIGAYRLAKRIHSKENFNCVQHITFVSFRQPSFMGGLGIPFIFGPVGGGETMPRQFRKSIPFLSQTIEFGRDLGSSLVSLDPLMWLTFARAEKIACATDETLDRIPRRFREKCVVQRAIGINESEIEVKASVDTESMSQFLYVGRLLYWKGLHLVIRALAQVRRTIPGARLKVVGEGEDCGWLEGVARDANVIELIEWAAAKPRSEIWQEYRKSLAFVFPSLHDSGGMVVLEALAAGLPVVCLNLGGPGSIVTSSCGVVVEARVGTEDEVIEQVARSMIALANDSELRARMSAGAVARARQVSWDAAVDSLYSSFLDAEQVMQSVDVAR
jgi:glycosyltransferase involved in cell wall biosynthesis